MTGFYGVERRNADELELVIAGAGAAGLSAAIHASLLDINYLLFDAEEGGGLMNLAKTVENMPGVSGKRGPEITESLLAQLAAAGGALRGREPIVSIELLPAAKADEEPAGAAHGRAAKRAEPDRQRILVRTFRAEYRPQALIIATGLELLGLEQEFGIVGEREFLGKGVSYCAECDGPLFRDKRVMVVGSPFDAFLLKRLAREVVYLGPVPDEFRSQVPVEIIQANDIRYVEGNLDELVGRGSLEGVVVAGEHIPLDGLFLTKRSSSVELYQGIGVELDRQGFIRVDRHGETSLPGIYAAGDVTGEPWQISKSIGEGAVAALSAFRFLTGQEMRNLGWALEEEWER